MDEIKALREKQIRNKIINEHKDVFFAVCNKMLDLLYNGVSPDTEEEATRTVSDLTKSLEMTRKKIHNDATLDEHEIVHVILASQYVQADLAAKAENLVLAAQELNSLLKDLTFSE